VSGVGESAGTQLSWLGRIMLPCPVADVVSAVQRGVVQGGKQVPGPCGRVQVTHRRVPGLAAGLRPAFVSGDRCR
jgi:hypothetical protein